MSSRWWKEVDQGCLWAFLSLLLSSYLFVLLLPTPFRANCLLKRVFLVPLFAFFLYHSFFGSFPCSFFTPGDIFWPPHISLSLPQLLLFFALYGGLSRCSNCPLLDIYQIWIQCWMNNYFWLNTYGGIPCVTSLCCFHQQWLDNAHNLSRY